MLMGTGEHALEAGTEILCLAACEGAYHELLPFVGTSFAIVAAVHFVQL